MNKLNQSLVDTVFSKKIGFARDSVMQGPAYGVDCSVVSITDNLGMVIASDPLSIIPQIGMDASAFLSLQLAANDIATSGLRPQYGQFVLSFPNFVDKGGFEHYCEFIHQYAQKMEIAITGGHTSFVAGNNSTLAGGLTLFAVGEMENILTSTQAEEGDVLLMTKTAGLTATSVLAMVFSNFVNSKLEKEIGKRASFNFWNISVLLEAQTVSMLNKHAKIVTAMHDVTEGGVIGAAYEFAAASNNGICVDTDKILVSMESTAIANVFDLDAKSTIGAGSMLISCKPDKKDIIINQIQRQGIPCTVIGKFLSEQEGKYIISDNREYELQTPSADKYWEVFSKSIENGLS
ncbi:AIR synthase-related protein [Sphingobacterium bovistauri]|uniref:AIR synthase n=1 Tax=Sphingobacterium bovistauri TaxID=2781959 RepID=A0ABS7Z9T8_9SPHI|nr:AIR synthase-related protein [Sphingobacterium bovistauri]MCA5005474.1 AIR synthase [Sphingobacterium bovistauri]